MKNTSSGYFLMAHKFWKTVVNKQTSANPAKLQQQLEMHQRLLNVFQPGGYYYLIFNMYTGNADFISDTVKDVLGYEPEEMSVEFMIDKIHPDDRPFFLNFEYSVVEFFKNLPFQKVPLYKVQYDIRMKASCGTYRRMLHQAVQIDYDEQNFYRTLCFETDISHIKPEGIPCFSIIGLDGEPSYYNIQTTSNLIKSYSPFTNREREVLKGIIEGKSSKELAEELFVSLHTINSHRKNILKKAQVKTIVDLVKTVINEGWV